MIEVKMNGKVTKICLGFCRGVHMHVSYKIHYSIARLCAHVLLKVSLQSCIEKLCDHIAQKFLSGIVAPYHHPSCFNQFF